MARHPVLPELGRIVQIVRGRDRGSYAVVIGHEAGRFVIVADGMKRKVENPKKKNGLHVLNTSHIAEELIEGLMNKPVRVTNAEIRYALRQRIRLDEGTTDGNQEGAIRNGEG